MKKLIIYLFIIFPCIAFAQWQQALNIFGGSVNTFAVKDSIALAGTDTGGIFSSADNGLHWTANNNGLSNKNVKALLVKNNLIIAGIYDGLSSGVSFLSSDNGATWTPSINPYFGFLFCLSLSGSNILAGSWYGVIKSSDNGASWTTLSITGLPGNASISALALSGTNMIAGVSGSSDGSIGVFVSTDNGANWIRRNNGLTDTMINSLVVSGTNIFAGTYAGGVFSSSDNGLHWTAMNTGLSNLKINTLMVNGTTLFAGTDNGIFSSFNNGTNWKNISDSLPANSSVSSIAVKGEYLLAGTKFTVWRRKISEVSGLNEKITEPFIVNIYPNPTTDKLFIDITSQHHSTNIPIEVIDLKGTKLISHNQIVQTSVPLSIDVSNLSEGMYFLMINNRSYKFIKCDK